MARAPIAGRRGRHRLAVGRVARVAVLRAREPILAPVGLRDGRHTVAVPVETDARAAPWLLLVGVWLVGPGIACGVRRSRLRRTEDINRPRCRRERLEGRCGTSHRRKTDQYHQDE